MRFGAGEEGIKLNQGELLLLNASERTSPESLDSCVLNCFCCQSDRQHHCAAIVSSIVPAFIVRLGNVPPVWHRAVRFIFTGT